MDAVRKCLQVELVPLLRPYTNPTCKDIKQKAFSSHSGCYVDPFEGAPSICNISFRDWLQVVSTVKYALDWRLWEKDVLHDDAEIFSEGLGVFQACYGDTLAVRTIRVLFYITPVGRILYSAFTVAKQIHDLLTSAYDTDAFLIYPYVPDKARKRRAVNKTGEVDVYVLMAQRSEYDLNFKQGKTIDMGEAADYFLDKVSTGKFRPNLTDGVELKTYTLCGEMKCQNPNRTVEQPIVISAYGGLHRQSNFFAIIVSMLALMF